MSRECLLHHGRPLSMPPGSGLCVAREPRLPRSHELIQQSHEPPGRVQEAGRRAVYPAPLVGSRFRMLRIPNGVYCRTHMGICLTFFPAPMLLVISGLTLLASVAVIAGRGALVASKRAARGRGRILINTARDLNVTIAQLAPCLGVSVGTVARWTVDGVPRSKRDDVRRLGHRAAALTRCLSADRALHLLELQRRAADSLADGTRQMRDAERIRETTGSSARPRLMRRVLITSR